MINKNINKLTQYLNKGLISSLMKKKIVRNVLAVASGTVAAQVINILFSPIITRIYGPEVFGVLGTFTSILNIVAPIAALTYPIAIVLPKEDNKAMEILKMSLKIALFTSALMAVLILFFGDIIFKILKLENISSYFILIPLGMFFAVSLQVMQQWSIRKKLFSLKARVSVLNTLVVNVSQVAIGIYKPIAIVLIFIFTLGNFTHSFLLAVGLRIFSKGEFFTQSKKRSVNSLALAKEYYDFPVYRAPEMLINGISQSLPVIMLTTFFGPAAAGFYTISKKVLGLPSLLIGQAIGDVFYPHISEAAHCNSKISDSLIKATLVLALIGIVPFGAVIIFGPWLFSNVFGSDWAIAGVYARWLSIWLFFMFINNPSTRTLPVISQQRLHLIISIISIVVRLAALFIGGIYFGSDVYAIMLYSISGAIVNFGLILVTISKCRKYDSIEKEI